jgi:membrane-bound lytic murein transglycosylase B
MDTRHCLIFILIALMAVPLLADADTKSMTAPTTWSDQVEKELVSMIAKNEQAHQVYARVVNRLRRSGVPASYVHEVFSNNQVRVDEEIIRRLDRPYEKLEYDRYRQIFVNEKRISRGVDFYNQYRFLIHDTADRFGVDPYLLLSFVGVETWYGKHSSEFLVFNSLHTLIHHVPRRAKFAEDEMVAWFMICRMEGLPPLGMKGSYAGAFGYGQFMPTSFKKYAVDGDGDGTKEPYDWPDVMASIANYLLERGKYDPASSDFSTDSRNWRAVYKYNPSRNYVQVVLELRQELIRAIEDS